MIFFPCMFCHSLLLGFKDIGLSSKIWSSVYRKVEGVFSVGQILTIKFRGNSQMYLSKDDGLLQRMMSGAGQKFEGSCGGCANLLHRGTSVRI